MTEFVTFAVQAGSSEANQAVSPYYLRLRYLLARHCSRGYGEDFNEFAFVLRIDGHVFFWNKSGCGNLKVNVSKGIATIDIFMMSDTWKSLSKDVIVKYLAEETRVGFYMMLEHSKHRGILIQEGSLSEDFEIAIEKFLKGLD